MRRQDLHAFLLDNYFLLTRDEENGKHVVVSRVSPRSSVIDMSLSILTSYISQPSTVYRSVDTMEHRGRESQVQESTCRLLFVVRSRQDGARVSAGTIDVSFHDHRWARREREIVYALHCVS